MTGRKIALMILIAFLLIIGERLAAQLIGCAVIKSNQRFSRLYQGGMHHDTIVLGNSRGVNLINVLDAGKITNSSIFNLSYNGMSASICEVLLKDYLKYNVKPKTLIFEVSCIAAGNGAIKDIKTYAYWSKGIDAFFKEMYPTEHDVCQISSLYYFNSELLLRSLYYLNKTDQNWMNNGRISNSLLQDTLKMTPVSLQAHEKELQALGRIIETSKKKEFKVILVIAPYLPSYYAHINNFQQWLYKIKQLAGDDVKTLDYSKSIDDVSCFADRVHTNSQGGRIVLKKLISANAF